MLAVIKGEIRSRKPN